MHKIREYSFSHKYDERHGLNSRAFQARVFIPNLTSYFLAMAALQQDDKTDDARQNAHLEESSPENAPGANHIDFVDDPKREIEESGMSYTKQEEGEALKRLDWNLIPL